MIQYAEMIKEMQEHSMLAGKLNIGEKTIIKALTSYGYNQEELKKMLIKLGDVGSLAEYVTAHPRQTKITDFFK